METIAELMTKREVAREAQGRAVPMEPGWRAALGRLLRGAKERRSHAAKQAQLRTDGLFMEAILMLMDAACYAVEAVEPLDGDEAGVAGRLDGAMERIMAVPTRFIAIEAAKQACVMALADDPMRVGPSLAALVARMAGMELDAAEQSCAAMACEAMLIAGRQREMFTVDESFAGALGDTMNVALMSNFCRMRAARAGSEELAEQLDRETPPPMGSREEAGRGRL